MRKGNDKIIRTETYNYLSREEYEKSQRIRKIFDE